jgi:hypothetical protein
LEAYESGWQKALELGIFNKWTAKMREALGRLNTELYPPLLEIGFAMQTQSSTELPPLIAATRRNERGASEPHLIESQTTTKAAGAKPEQAAP